MSRARSPHRIVALVDCNVDLRTLKTRKGAERRWYNAHVIDGLRELGHDVLPIRFHADLHQAISEIIAAKPELVFNLTLHAQNLVSRQPHVPAVLDLLRIPYVGSSSHAMYLTSNKGLSKVVVNQAGVAVPPFVVLREGNIQPYPFKYPAIVKPLSMGGSVGISERSLVTNFAELEAQVALLRNRWRMDLIVEEYIAGRELSVWVIGNDKPEVLPINEWVFPDDGLSFLTERAKWNRPFRAASGISARPAQLNRVEQRAVREATLTAYRALELRDYAKIEFRMTKEGIPAMMDANANPGLRPTPLNYGWVPFQTLLRRIVAVAWRRALDDPK